MGDYLLGITLLWLLLQVLLRDGGIVTLICLAERIDRPLAIQLNLVGVGCRSLDCVNRCLEIDLGTVSREVGGGVLRSEEVQVAVAT